jgi:hypothetical protein
LRPFWDAASKSSSANANADAGSLRNEEIAGGDCRTRISRLAPVFLSVRVCVDHVNRLSAPNLLV